MISYVISSFDRPMALLTCVSSLCQQEAAHEIVICDNSVDPANRNTIESTIAKLPDVKYLRTYETCPPELNAGYKAQNIGAATAKGDWLCFPSDDCYYVPGFQHVMLQTASDFGLNAGLVYCDMVYDPRYN